jgi:hypothetical protein
VEAEAVTFPYLIASAVLLLVKAIQLGGVSPGGPRVTDTWLLVSAMRSNEE